MKYNCNSMNNNEAQVEEGLHSFLRDGMRITQYIQRLYCYSNKFMGRCPYIKARTQVLSHLFFVCNSTADIEMENSIDLELPSDIESEFQCGQAAGDEDITPNVSLEAKLQANSTGIHKLSLSFASMQNMLTNMVKNQQSSAIPVDNMFDVDDFVGQQGNCYDPNQNFELISNVAASSPSKQEEDFDLSCEDIYETSEAKGAEISKR